jgi:hypothetical protein
MLTRRGFLGKLGRLGAAAALAPVAVAAGGAVAQRAPQATQRVAGGVRVAFANAPGLRRGWVEPRSWVSGETVTAERFNTIPASIKQIQRELDRISLRNYSAFREW